MTMGNPQELLTVNEVIKELGISRSLWNALRIAGSLPPIIKMGRLHRVRREALNAWLIEREQAA